MFTIKQLEALYWTNSLGGLLPAAEYLHVTQSTISKRLAELEQQFPEPLFMREGRRTVLTARGESVREVARRMLRLNDQLVENASGQAPLPFRVRLGATDLVAMSWLPALITAMRDTWPELAVETEIDLTTQLTDGLAARKLDLVICPANPAHEDLVSLPLGEIPMAWMCSPALLDGRASLTIDELTQLTLLAQSPGSVLRSTLLRMLASRKLQFPRHINCNNMGALAEMAAKGMGVTILPLMFFQRMLNEGRLVVVDCPLPLPALAYYVTYRKDYHEAFYADIAELCETVWTL